MCKPAKILNTFSEGIPMLYKIQLKTAVNKLVIFSLLAFLAILFFDKPLALWIHQQNLDSLFLSLGLNYITENIPMALSFVVLIFLVWIKPTALIANKWRYIIYLFLLTLFTVTIKQYLKIFFGRYWPNTWKDNNLSLIQDHIYGFDWFHGAVNAAGSSFPSGHTTFVAIICFSLMLSYPKWRPVWFFFIGLMIFSLIILNYHFLGDCLAALALAAFCANIGFIIYQKAFKS